MSAQSLTTRTRSVKVLLLLKILNICKSNKAIHAVNFETSNFKVACPCRSLTKRTRKKIGIRKSHDGIFLQILGSGSMLNDTNLQPVRFS